MVGEFYLEKFFHVTMCLQRILNNEGHEKSQNQQDLLNLWIFYGEFLKQINKGQRESKCHFM